MNERIILMEHLQEKSPPPAPVVVRGQTDPAWVRVWRAAVNPLLSLDALDALWKGLLYRDPRITRKVTTEPPPLLCLLDWPLMRADPIGYAAWQGDGLKLVGEVEEFFARVAAHAEVVCGEPGALRHYLHFWDDGDPETCRLALLGVVEEELADRLCF